MREQDIPYYFEGLQSWSPLEYAQSVIVGDYPNLANFTLVTPMQNRAFPTTAKQYVNESGLNIFVFPNIMILLNQLLYHYETFKDSVIVFILKNYTDIYLAGFGMKYHNYYCKRFGGLLLFMKFVCIPPDEENYKILFDFLLAQKQNHCGLPKTTKFILSEEQKVQQLHSNKKIVGPYSWQDWKDLAKGVVSCAPEQTQEIINFYQISHRKLKALYERFDGTLDTLISYRQELAKLCTNLSKFRYDLAATEKLSFKAGLELIRSISFALEASRWNPKWSKSYYRMKKASKLEFDLTYDENARDDMFNTLKEHSLITLHRMRFGLMMMKNMKAEKNMEEMDRVLNGEVNDKDLINYRKLLSEDKLNEARNYFQSESPNACLTTYNLVLDAKFLNPDNPNCSIILKEYVEILHSKATERELLFKKVQEDKMLRDLVLFDIGYNLITKVNKNPNQEIPIQSLRFQYL